ncbi:hypothetical protein BGW39_000423, partial [Mortierella sp. 14UC]
MGVPLLWQLIQQEGYNANLLWQFSVAPLPPGSFYRVNIFAFLFSTIQRIYAPPVDDQHTCYLIFEQHLVSRQIPKDAAFLYIDGPSPVEKRTTSESREPKRTLALQKAQACIGVMEERVRNRRRLRKRYFNKLYKLTRAAFYCDMLVHNTVETIWRPLGRSRFLAYKVADVCRTLDLFRAQLTLLGIVSKNDYTSSLTRLGVATNYKIVNRCLGLGGAVLEPSRHCNQEWKPPAHFEAAVRVFARRKFTAPADQTPNAQLEPSDPASQNAATEDEAQQPTDLQSILSRLQALQIRAKENRNSSYTVQEKEPLVVSNRNDTVDCLPEQRPRQHESGRKYKYRQRFAVKTRSHLQKHEPPEPLKQYQLKPCKSPPDSPLDCVNSTTQPRTQPKVRDVTHVDKKNLVEAMAWDHPTGTLELGTVNSNTSFKRTCQIAVGRLVEALAIHHIKEAEEDDITHKDDTKDMEDMPKKKNNQDDEDNEGEEGNMKPLDPEDRHLRLPCPGFSDKDLADFGKEYLEHKPATQVGLDE